MTITASGLLAAMLWALAAATTTWVVLAPLRRRYLAGLLASVVLTGTASALGAMLGGVHEMLIPMTHLLTMVALIGVAGGLATIAAALAARRLRQDSRALLRAMAAVGQGQVPDTRGRRLTAELEGLRLELSRTATALTDARDRERTLERARRELVSWVSHDLRTPLAGLRAMSEALEDGVVDDPGAYYRQIGASAGQLSEMVDDLFELSRIQTQSSSRYSESVALDDLVSECVAALTPLATACGVDLSGHAVGATAVLGNGPELNRALTNLIANAIRHTRAHGAVTVSVSLTAGVRQLAEVSVSDECGGIPEAEIPRVFEVGFRGDPARTPRPNESIRGGLGLAITRGIVEAHEGSVDVENTADGCTFRVRLPIAA